MNDHDKLQQIATHLRDASMDPVLGAVFRDSCNHLLTIFVRDGLLHEPPGWSLELHGTEGFRER